MIRVKCPKCGLMHPKSAWHRCPPDGSNEAVANDNAPFDYAAWRKKYMREYMVRYRLMMKTRPKPEEET